MDIKDPAETVATDKQVVKETPKTWLEVCKMFYGERSCKKIDELMTEHLTTAAKSGSSSSCRG